MNRNPAGNVRHLLVLLSTRARECDGFIRVPDTVVADIPGGKALQIHVVNGQVVLVDPVTREVFADVAD